MSAGDPIVCEIAPDIHGIGGVYPVDARVPWVPVGSSGFDPCLGYLIRAGDAAVLVDTGLACHQEQVLAALDRLWERDRPLTVVATRVDPDCVGNLEAIARAFRVTEVVSIHRSPVDFFEYPSPADPPYIKKQVGEWLPLGGADRLLLLAAPLRILHTIWVYDRTARVLFTSDSFGHTHLPAPDAPPVHAGEAAEPAAARAHLLTRFEWLGDASVLGPLQSRLAGVFDGRDVEVIAPSHGCVLAGRELVRQTYRIVSECLARMGARE